MFCKRQDNWICTPIKENRSHSIGHKTRSNSPIPDTASKKAWNCSSVPSSGLYFLKSVTSSPSAIEPTAKIGDSHMLSNPRLLMYTNREWSPENQIKSEVR